MDKKFIIIAIVLLIGVIFFSMFKQGTTVIGSVAIGDGYRATTTSSWTAVASPSTLKMGQGMFGSFVVTSTNTANPITLYDATTSDITKRNNVASSSLIVASLPGGATVGTYVYDVDFVNGLLLTVTGTAAGTTTITWK